MRSYVPKDDPADRPRTSRETVRVILIDNDKTLLFEDSDPGIPDSHWWVTPGGGIDDGESQQQTAIREVREETGYDCDIIAVLAETTHETGQGTKTVAWYVMRPVPEGSGTLPDDEIDEVRWLSPEEAMALVDYENDRRLIEQAPFEQLLRGRGPS